MGKKVGIVSCYFKNNYGSMLQAYATKKILDNNHIPNETININYNEDFKNGKKKFYAQQISNIKFIKSKYGMIKMKFDKLIRKKLRKNIAIRNKKYQEFRKQINFSRGVSNYKDLTQLAKERYTDVIVGSDQLWLPVNVIADYYTLNWVPNDINKISYSTSFGISSIPSKYEKKYQKFLNRINFLSVREKSGVILVQKLIHKTPKLVCDPTMLLTKKEWEKLIPEKRIISDKYILCYFLGSNIHHRKFVERLKKYTDYQIVSLNHSDEFVPYSDQFADITPYDIGPLEWIQLIKNAEYICTDSFHGTVFSILFEKVFFSFRRYKENSISSTNSRIDSLLHTVGISEQRILTGNESVEDVLKYKISYNKVRQQIEQFRNESMAWLLHSIKWQEQPTNYIHITSKEDCCGCSACVSICPKGAIEMKLDQEGFKYPQRDDKKCIHCGLCKKVCPILNKEKNKRINQIGYIFQNSNKEIRKESTSGGFFTALAEYVLTQNGAIYGAAFDKQFRVIHKRVTDSSQLGEFRNSKYVQSDPQSTFLKVRKDLNNHMTVLYSGTTCQIEGLRRFLQKDYENLITVDVICRSVPSPLLWDKYLASKNKKITKALFREKVFGYKYSNLTLYDKNGRFYKNGIDTDPYLRAFFSNIASRPSCYNCRFKEQFHISDFTIWDCFDVAKYDYRFDDDIGTTKVLINTLKGRKLFKKFSTNHRVKKIEVEQLVSNFHQMFYSIKYNHRRKEFFDDLNNKELNIVLEKYFPHNIKSIFEKNMRLILIKTKLYSPILKIGKKLRKRD